MVKLARTISWPLAVIDASGICIVGVCVGASLWLTLVRHENTQEEIVRLQETVQESHHQVVMLGELAERQRALLLSRRADLSQRGRVPERAPVEEYFRALSVLAARHNVRVVSQTPIESRNYAGLLEQCFAYEVAGSMPDLVRLFRDVEETEFWADISYLKIDQGLVEDHGAAPQRIAAFTLSLFSTPVTKAGIRREGT